MALQGAGPRVACVAKPGAAPGDACQHVKRAHRSGLARGVPRKLRAGVASDRHALVCHVSRCSFIRDGCNKVEPQGVKTSILHMEWLIPLRV